MGYVPPEAARERLSEVSDEATLPDVTLRDARPGGARILGTSSGGDAPREDGARGRTTVVVDLVEEQGPPSLLQGPWPAVEVWTRNRIYVLDSVMRCIDVVDRPTGASDPDSPLMGAVLFGGQRRDEKGRIVEISHPFPRPGTQAVFGCRVGRRFSLSETSAVSKVVLRVRAVHLEAEEPLDWERIRRSTADE